MRTWSRSGSNRPRLGWPVSIGRAIVLAGAGRRVVMDQRPGRALRGALRRVLLAVGIDVQGLGALFRRFLVDHDLGDVALAGQLEHRLEQDALHDRPKAAGT